MIKRILFVLIILIPFILSAQISDQKSKHDFKEIGMHYYVESSFKCIDSAEKTFEFGDTKRHIKKFVFQKGSQSLVFTFANGTFNDKTPYEIFKMQSQKYSIEQSSRFPNLKYSSSYSKSTLDKLKFERFDFKGSDSSGIKFSHYELFKSYHDWEISISYTNSKGDVLETELTSLFQILFD